MHLRSLMRTERAGVGAEAEEELVEEAPDGIDSC